MLTFADVIEALTGVRPPRGEHIVTDAVVDHRQVIPSALYVDLQKDSEVGIPRVAEALDRNAMLVLTQHSLPANFRTLNISQALRPATLSGQDLPLCLQVEDVKAALYQIAGFWWRRVAPRVIGITGSVGKTTTKDLTVEVLEQRYRTLKNAGIRRSEIEIPLAILNMTEGHQRAVLEISFDALEDPLLRELIAPHIVVITNVSTAHASQYSSQAEMSRPKVNLLRDLPGDGIAILNYDDPWVHQMAEHTSAQTFFYGLDPRADVWADGVEGLGLDGIRFQLHYGDEAIHLRVPMIGRHAVHTALRAAAVGLVEGLPWQDIVQGLRFGHAQLRLVAVYADSGALVLDDTYNASPESVLAALNLLDEMDGRKIAVLSGMPDLGSYERQGHELVGIRVAQVVDHLVTVGELGRQIAVSARSTWLPHSAITEVDAPDEAITFLRENLTSNDTVLVKGTHRLHMDQIVSALESHP